MGLLTSKQPNKDLNSLFNETSDLNQITQILQTVFQQRNLMYLWSKTCFKEIEVRPPELPLRSKHLLLRCFSNYSEYIKNSNKTLFLRFDCRLASYYLKLTLASHKDDLLEVLYPKTIYRLKVKSSLRFTPTSDVVLVVPSSQSKNETHQFKILNFSIGGLSIVTSAEKAALFTKGQIVFNTFLQLKTSEVNSDIEVCYIKKIKSSNPAEEFRVGFQFVVLPLIYESVINEEVLINTRKRFTFSF